MSTKITISMTAEFSDYDEEHLNQATSEGLAAIEDRLYRRRKTTKQLTVPIYSWDNRKVGTGNISIEETK